MSLTRFAPEEIPADLITLTRELGNPIYDLAILAEGNTSVLLESGEIAVKASGVGMRGASAESFVICPSKPLVEMMDDRGANQDDLTSTLDAGVIDGQRRRGSIETLIHAAVRSVSPVAFVAHTHPAALVALLSSKHGETSFDSFVYSDEAVVIGKAMWVPYAQPGMDLGRLFLGLLREHVEANGVLPSLTLLANHGIVAISETWEGALAISLMANKGARIRLDALAAGGVVPLSDAAVSKYFARADIVERRQNISGA